MKNKKEEEKPRDKPASAAAKSKVEKPRKVPSKMGYHGKDDEKDLNPEE